MAKVIHRTLCSIVLILCFVLAVHAQLGDTKGDSASQADAEQRVVSSTTSLEELRQAIDELKSLIRVVGDIQDSIKKATVRHSRLLRRVHPELTSSADRGDTPDPVASELPACNVTLLPRGEQGEHGNIPVNGPDWGCADACPSGQCKAQHKRKTPQLPSKADMWKRPLFALCLGLVGYWHFTRLKCASRIRLPCKP